MKKRWPFLVVAAVGLVLWRGAFGWLPSERALVFRLPGSYSDIQHLEVQVWRGDELLKREELPSPHGLTVEPTVRVSLSSGPHRAVVSATGGSSRTWSVPFDPGSDDTVVVMVR